MKVGGVIRLLFNLILAASLAFMKDSATHMLVVESFMENSTTSTWVAESPYRLESELHFQFN